MCDEKTIDFLIAEAKTTEESGGTPTEADAKRTEPEGNDADADDETGK